MVARISYYIFVIPISYLPLFMLYGLTDFLYILLTTVFPYRKKVIEGNIYRSFPKLSQSERNKLRRKFYRHLTNLLAEGVKSLSISDAQLRNRLTVKNPEVMKELYKKNKNVLLVSGHYNNWEWLVLGQGLLFDYKAVGIGMPMTSKFWDRKINARRSRYGMKVVHSKNYKEELNKSSADLKAVLVLTDQSPGNSLKSYWMDFLNQPTAVLFGTELMAHELDYAVVYYTMHKIKRGRYDIELKLISENPSEMKWGEITEAHTRLLEAAIQKEPENWLWSHKRWKREIPEDLENLKTTQREYFDKKFAN